jgi:membrane-associated phospholipid phosphatase
VSEALDRLPPRRLLLAVGVSASLTFVLLAIASLDGSYRDERGPGPLWAEKLGHAGSYQVLPLATVILALALALVGFRRSPLFLVAAVVGAGALSYLTKYVLRLLGEAGRKGSLAPFPSGHVAAVTALVGALLVIAWAQRAPGVVRLLGALVLLAAVGAMSWAQVVTTRHSVLDVAGGAVLAVAWLAICAAAMVYSRRGGAVPSS